jgi:hypothetical protein
LPTITAATELPTSLAHRVNADGKHAMAFWVAISAVLILEVGANLHSWVWVLSLLTVIECAQSIIMEFGTKNILLGRMGFKALVIWRTVLGIVLVDWCFGCFFDNALLIHWTLVSSIESYNFCV